MNHVTLIGRITRNLVLRETNSGKHYVFFTVAVNDLTNKTDYISCISWNRVAQNMTKFVGKGSLVAVSGRITTRKDNKDQYITEVVANTVSFLDRKKDADSGNVSDYESSKNKLKDIDEAFKDTESYDTEISFVNNNNANGTTIDDAIIWD